MKMQVKTEGKNNKTRRIRSVAYTDKHTDVHRQTHTDTHTHTDIQALAKYYNTLFKQNWLNIKIIEQLNDTGINLQFFW